MHKASCDNNELAFVNFDSVSVHKHAKEKNLANIQPP